MPVLKRTRPTQEGYAAAKCRLDCSFSTCSQCSEGTFSVACSSVDIMKEQCLQPNQNAQRRTEIAAKVEPAFVVEH